MSSKDLAFVAIRVLAIYYLITAISVAFSAVSGVLTLVSLDESNNNTNSFIYFSLIPFVLHLGAAAVLWIFANRISSFVSLTNLTNNSKSEFKIEEFQVVIFASIGLYLVFSSLPYIAGTLYKYIEIKDFDKYALIPSEIHADTMSLSLQILLGVTLFFGARGFSGLLTWTRSLGLKSK